MFLGSLPGLWQRRSGQAWSSEENEEGIYEPSFSGVCSMRQDSKIPL